MQHLSDQVINKLEACVAHEAEQFALPYNWQAGRPQLTATSIDNPRARHIDDAITLTTIDDQLHAQVSIVDVGSFIAADSATALSVERRAFTDGRNGNYLLAHKIGIRTLSLAPQAERPTLTIQFPIFEHRDHKRMEIFRSVTRANLLSSDEVNKQLTGKVSEHTLALRSLYRAAQLLGNRLLRQRFYGIDVFSPDNHPLDDLMRQDPNPAFNLVRQYMSAANEVAGRIATSRAIPLLYRHLLEVEPGVFKDGYEAVPDANKMNPKRDYARVTSPLWRGPDFLNHLNIVAREEGREYPYSKEYLEDMAVWFTHVEQTSDRDYTTGPPFIPKIQDYVKHYNVVTHDQMVQLKTGTATPGDLRDILFSSAVAGIAEAKELAARHLEYNPSLAAEVLALAVADGYLTEFRDTEGKLLGYSANGRIARYSRLAAETYPIACNLSELRIISELSNIVIVPKLKDLGLAFFYRAASKKQLRFTCNNYKIAGGQHQVVLHVETPDQRDTFRAVAATLEDARTLACTQVHEQFGLLDKLPPERSILNVNANAWAALTLRQQRAGLPAATHTFEGEGDLFVCTIKVVDIRDGQTHEYAIKGHGRSKKAAKHAAAEKLLDELPNIQLSSKSLRIMNGND